MTFDHKHFLLDTNILIEASKDSDKLLSPFFAFIQEKGGAMYITNASYFEFMRYARSEKEFQELDTFARSFPIIEMRDDDIQRAIQLSVLCNHKRPDLKKQISFVDALLAAQLLKFRSEVVLVTTDIYDFPDCVFDRVKVQAYDLGSRVVTVAFIALSLERYGKCVSDFKNSVA